MRIVVNKKLLTTVIQVMGDLYSKTCLKWPLKKKTKIGFQDRLSLNAGQKYFFLLFTFYSELHLYNICITI